MVTVIIKKIQRNKGYTNKSKIIRNGKSKHPKMRRKFMKIVQPHYAKFQASKSLKHIPRYSGKRN